MGWQEWGGSATPTHEADGRSASSLRPLPTLEVCDSAVSWNWEYRQTMPLWQALENSSFISTAANRDTSYLVMYAKMEAVAERLCMNTIGYWDRSSQQMKMLSAPAAQSCRPGQQGWLSLLSALSLLVNSVNSLSLSFLLRLMVLIKTYLLRLWGGRNEETTSTVIANTYRGVCVCVSNLFS